ncbi:hypothetical protein VA7868_01144 [Vibrio aerogenes CECT 7868]|uniref:Macrodomain Ori protein n=1 Tax=Vibrio aerogenes CECT 7868 TaxID=1216006 RepID=A0A1M5XFN8_9VIBR|nr:DUF413 domain-containing protein [Vibrio aerogenes]SHH98657.1 hypothetical protein VA7868_01144 [Vibrio aerogenes CECT 7868]
MVESEIRIGEKRFYDNKAFPRGFSKSGNFTLAEDDILSSYGQTLQALESGEIMPVNTEEKHFLKALRNPGKSKSKIEKTWLKYIQIARGRKSFHTLNGNRRHQETLNVDVTDAEMSDEVYG